MGQGDVSVPEPPPKVTVMGDSTWWWKTSKRVTEDGNSKWDHKRAFLLRKIYDLGACNFDLDIDTAKLLATGGFRVHEGIPAVTKMVTEEALEKRLSGDGRLLIWVDNGKSWTESDSYKPDWASLMVRCVDLAKLVTASWEKGAVRVGGREADTGVGEHEHSGGKAPSSGPSPRHSRPHPSPDHD